jgi:fructose-bisphosphate aldolase class I
MMKQLGREVKDEVTRKKYRQIVLSTKGLGKYIGGVILHDETIRQRADDGVEFVELLKSEGIAPGIKVDKGFKDLAMFKGEKITEGLDGLRERLEEYVKLGAKFTKWRSVIVIDEGIPTRQAVQSNAHALARYAALSQEAGLVPIVEPEVLMEGNHTVEGCAEATEMVGRVVFEVLRDMRIDMRGMLYKPNMVVPGRECATQVDVDVVAAKTVEVMKKVVSVDLPGVVFLSGGQDAKLATVRLNRISQMGAGVPWRWTFSFERALEEPAMRAWQGKSENSQAAQEALLARARYNSEASLGTFKEENA